MRRPNPSPDCYYAAMTQSGPEHKQVLPNHRGAPAIQCTAYVSVGAAAALGLAAAALAVVAAYVSSGVPTSWHLVGDAAGYMKWAEKIAAGEWVGREGFYQAPLYPYLLAIVMKLIGATPWHLIVVQSLMHGGAVGLLSFATGRMFGRTNGLIAGIMLAIYPPAVFAAIIIQKSALDLLLTSLLVALLAGSSRAGRAISARRAVAMGIVCALLSLTRENALLWVPLCGTYIWWVQSSCRNKEATEIEEPVGAAKYVGAFIMGCALVLGPVAARNGLVSGEWSLTTFQSGPNFYIGNSAGADGRYRPLVRGHETPQFERHDAQELAEDAVGRKLSAREVSRYWWSRSWTDIVESPARWMKLLGYKLLLTINHYEIADAESLYVYAAYGYPSGVLTRIWHFGALGPLAVMGVMATWSRRPELWIYYLLIASMAGSVALFFVLARYRLPMVPLMIPFAAAGVVACMTAQRLRNSRQLILLLAPALVAAVVMNAPVQDETRLDALAWMNAGVAAAEGGDILVASSCFEHAVAEHPESPEANVNLALALAMQGRFAEAIQHYEVAVRSGIDLPGLDYNYAVALENAGRHEDALRHFQRAMQRDPNDVEARRAVERLQSN